MKLKILFYLDDNQLEKCLLSRSKKKDENTLFKSKHKK